MCGDSAPPPVADPGIADAAKRQAALGEEWLNFAKDQFKVSSGLQQQLQDTAKSTTDFFTNMAKDDRARWEEVFKPLEDDFVNTAKNYDTPEAREAAAATAKTDVQSAAALERGASDRRNAAMGINPDSGRFAGIDRALGLGTAAASVDAQNRARDTVEQKGLALKQAAIGLGSGLNSQASQNAAAGLSAAGVPLTALNQSQDIMKAGYTGAITGEKGSGDVLNNQYKTNVDVWDSQNKLDAANAQGIGSFAGTALGVLGGSNSANSILGKGLGSLGTLGLSFLSTKKAKENRKPVEEGKSLDAVREMPVETYDYKPGMGDGGSHVGPMAEDFAQATGKGDGTAIAAQDAIGIMMGAVKDLDKKVDRIAKAVGLGTMPKKAAPLRAAA